MIKQFINKIITQYSEHFKRGNLTLGSLPNLWELELKEMLEEAFKAGRKHVWDNYDKPEYSDFDDYLESLNVE